MRARAVIGANFGDEGKGLITDYLCATEGAGVVVRFNGGAQAGHTVVTQSARHVFSHVGSGAFCGVPTYLSHFFVCNPLLFAREVQLLNDTGICPIVYAHPNCLVTTFADMIINQALEKKRGDKPHGSVGVGFQETIQRSEIPHLKITMSDLWNHRKLEPVLYEICDKYAEFRTGAKLKDVDHMVEHFIKCCDQFADYVHPMGMQQCKDPIFEGAQGLLLDQDNKEYFPHVTRSNTGMKNVRILCAQAGITKIEPYYVSRTYLTRHGAGPLPGEDKKLSYHDDTNVPHAFQGSLRFAPLSYNCLYAQCSKDADGLKYKLALTHCDQLSHEFNLGADLFSHGPTRGDVKWRTPSKSLKTG